MIFILKKRLVFFYVIAAFLVIVIIVLAINKKDEKNQEKVEEEKIQFESGNTISLYRSQKGQIENVDLNYYLLCVVASEMPFKYEYEALKAQTVVARTYLFNKMKNNHEENGDVCDSFAHCQAFNDIENLEEIWKKKGFTQEEIIEGEEKIKKAIVESDGEIITYNNLICYFYYLCFFLLEINTTTAPAIRTSPPIVNIQVPIPPVVGRSNPFLFTTFNFTTPFEYSTIKSSL